MPPAAPQISVVIPTLGTGATLERVLDGFARQTAVASSFEVLVVVDRAATVEGAAATRRLLTAARPYELIAPPSPGRPGASANRNAGWRTARAPIVLFTDDDTVPTPPLIAEHLAAHAAHPDPTIAVAGRIRWAPELRLTPFMRWLDDGLQFDHSSVEGSEASWAHLYTANASIKRALIEQVGGYDEVDLPYLYEDLDWGYRAREHGLQVVLWHSAVVDHWGATSLEDWRRRVPTLARAELAFSRKHPELAPWFYARFADAARTTAGRGRGARLARFVPRSMPLIGEAVWRRAGQHWLQELAPAFLEAWEEASSAGSPPGGPK